MDKNRDMDDIRLVSLRDTAALRVHCADCVVLTRDGKIALQYRPPHWRTSPDSLCLFGGHAETGETPLAAMMRELHEETGAVIPEKEALYLGAITEAATGHSEAVHIFFWHDKAGSITGCYEAEMRLFACAEDALNAASLMPYARWALRLCHEKGMIA